LIIYESREMEKCDNRRNSAKNAPDRPLFREIIDLIWDFFSRRVICCLWFTGKVLVDVLVDINTGRQTAAGRYLLVILYLPAAAIPARYGGRTLTGTSEGEDRRPLRSGLLRSGV
jgi:hypothetical protein